MKKFILTLIIGTFVGVLSSCATIMRDNNQSVPINANVDDVHIKLINRKGQTVFEGQTPITASLKTSGDGYFDPQAYKVIATKDGYEMQQTLIDWNVSNWYIFGNLVIGGLIGYLIVDPLTGDMYYLDEEINLNMTPIK